MTFFDPTGNPVSYHQWFAIYEPCYFIGGPTHGKQFHREHQSSQFVENQVVAVLAQTFALSQKDLVLAMAWKIGVIDDQLSESTGVVHFVNNWPSTLIAANPYRPSRPWDFSKSILFLAANMATIRHQLLSANPQYLFNLQLQSFGPVYKLAVQFFVTNGRDPIYDQYAHRAALAIDQNLPPGSAVNNYRQVQSWHDYQGFQALLRRIGLLPEGTMFISRADDRALWVYGHFFNRPSGA